MRNNHISDILDEKPVSRLSADEKRLIEAHAAECSDCFAAYRAAETAAYLLKIRAAQTFEPSPFFRTRLMANIREKKVSVNPFALFSKMWRASRTLVAMMSLTVAALVGLTIFAPKQDAPVSAETNAFGSYSTDMVILDERLPTKSPTNEQVFRVIYSAKTNAGK